MNSLFDSTLLIVDDDPSMRAFLKTKLYGEPYKILAVSSAEEALDVLAREKVDVALSDEHMPGGMSGTDFLVKLRQKYPDVIRMMLTGHISYQTALRALNEGRVFKFIPKPCDPMELAISIRYAMQHKRTQDAFKQGEERFRRMSEAAFEGIAFLEKGRIMDVNQKFLEMFGYTRQELIGKHALELTAPEYRDTVSRNIAEKYEKPYEVVCLRKNRTAFPAEVHGKTVLLEDNELRVTAVRDITERKQAEQELIRAKEQAESATRIKDNFITLVSHNLKSPLISMMSLVQSLYLDKDFSANTECKDTLDKLMQGAERAIGTIDELLNYSRLQSGMFQIMPRFIDANAVAELSMMSLYGMASAKGVTIVNEIPKDTRIYADPHLFGEVILNLVSNAIKFTRKGGRITIFIPEGMGTTIAVRDTGMGISEKLLPRLFVSDMLTSTAGTEGEKGTGLGLPMSMNIMKAHGGSLTAESKVGVGSVFYAALPHVQPVAFLVGLDDGFRSALEDCLRQIGAEAVFFSGAKEAAAREKRPHLLITGTGEGGKDALAHIGEIRAEADFAPIPLIVAAAGEGVDIRGRAEELGVSDFIAMPAPPADIVRRLRRVFA